MKGDIFILDVTNQWYAFTCTINVFEISDYNQEFEGVKINVHMIVDEWRAVMENHTQLLNQVIQNVSQLQGT